MERDDEERQGEEPEHDACIQGGDRACPPSSGRESLVRGGWDDPTGG